MNRSAASGWRPGRVGRRPEGEGARGRSVRAAVALGLLRTHGAPVLRAEDTVDLPQGERQRIFDVLDSLIRDAQARIAYAKPG